MNFYVHSLADTLLAAVDGSIDSSTSGYAKGLSGYLDAVAEDALVTPEDKIKLKEAEGRLDTATEEFKRVSKDAHNKYKDAKELGMTDLPFDQWVSQNYPLYRTAEGEVKKAQTDYQNVYNRSQGKIDILHEYRQNLKDALNTTAFKAGFNMHVQDKTAGLLPSYSAQGLTNLLQEWFKGRGTATAQPFFKFKVADIKSPGGAKDVFLEVTTKGFEKLDIKSGLWDIPNVKTLYPKLKFGSEDPLDPKLVRPFSFLIGFEVELRATMGENSQILASSGANPVLLGILCKSL